MEINQHHGQTWAADVGIAFTNDIIGDGARVDGFDWNDTGHIIIELGPGLNLVVHPWQGSHGCVRAPLDALPQTGYHVQGLCAVVAQPPIGSEIPCHSAYSLLLVPPLCYLPSHFQLNSRHNRASKLVRVVFASPPRWMTGVTPDAVTNVSAATKASTATDVSTAEGEYRDRRERRGDRER
jgi:hypothetical protein